MKRATPYLFLLLGFAQAAHSAEEIIYRLQDRLPAVSGFLHERIHFFPRIHFSDNLFLILNIAVIAVLFSFSPLVFKGGRMGVIMAKLIGTIEMLNGFAHLLGALIIWGYYPGAVSAGALLILGGLLLWF